MPLLDLVVIGWWLETLSLDVDCMVEDSGKAVVGIEERSGGGGLGIGDGWGISDDGDVSLSGIEANEGWWEVISTDAKAGNGEE